MTLSLVIIVACTYFHHAGHEFPSPGTTFVAVTMVHAPFPSSFVLFLLAFCILCSCTLQDRDETKSVLTIFPDCTLSIWPDSKLTPDLAAKSGISHEFLRFYLLALVSSNFGSFA